MVIMTEQEKEAIRTKLNHPTAEVRCPRCGNEVLYRVIGNSISVKCKTDDCIKGGIRGL